MARYGSRSQTPRRQPVAGAAKIGVTARMSPEAYEKAVRVAGALDVSISAFLAELVERLEVDERQLPPWESKYAPPAEPADPQLELSA